MAPTKHAATKKPSFKRARINSDHFKFADANMKYNDCYKEVTIIMEMVVHLESLEGTFIPEVFKERTWTKLLNPVEVVYSKIIREFFSNAAVDEDRINTSYRVLGKAQRICDYEGNHSRFFGTSSTFTAN